jgi:hypothetical protein
MECLSSVYTVVVRDFIYPAYFTKNGGIYQDQFMKFWLWKETNFSRIVYMDADTFFFRKVDFAAMFADDDERIVACPTPWSHWNQGRPMTWNGAFFIATPSQATADSLMSRTKKFNHFTSQYPRLSFLDDTEMGVFMEVFSDWHLPIQYPQVCSQISMCCQNNSGQCATHSSLLFLPDMVHSLKPRSFENTRLTLKHFNWQLDIFRGRHYDTQCIIDNFLLFYLSRLPATINSFDACVEGESTLDSDGSESAIV